MPDLVEKLLELDDVKVLGYQIKNRAFYIEGFSDIQGRIVTSAFHPVRVDVATLNRTKKL